MVLFVKRLLKNCGILLTTNVCHKVYTSNCYTLYLLHLYADVPPGPVMNLTVFAPDGSDSILIVTWLPPSGELSDILEILYYNVSVTNYSMTPVTRVNVSMDQTSTIVTGLGKCDIMHCSICASSDYYMEYSIITM